MASDGATLGPYGLADALAWVDVDNADFAAIAEWSFTDLRLHADAAATWGGPVIRFEVRQPPEPGGRWGMWRDSEACQTNLAEDYVLFHLQWEFNRVVLERREMTLHAAAVEVGGRAFLFSGHSMSGKTTFAGWLAANGAGFIADEIVAITPDSHSLHYRRPLGLRHGGPLEDRLHHPEDLDRRFDRYEMLVPVSSLGATLSAADSVPIGAIVFPFVDANSPSTVRSLAKSEAFEKLCDNAPAIARHGRRAFHRLAALVREVPTVELNTADLPRAQEQLTALSLNEAGQA